MSEHHSVTGAWIPETYDDRDKPFRSLPGATIKAQVNLLEDHPHWLEIVYDQLETKSCVANAASAAYRFLAHKLNENNATQQQLPYLEDPSRLFVYYNARVLEAADKLKRQGKPLSPEADAPKVTDNGANNRFALKSLNVNGITREEIWPFDISKIDATPGPHVYKEAHRIHILEYCRLDSNCPKSMEAYLTMEEKKAVGVVTLLQLRQCLSEGYPAIFGFWWYGPQAAFQEDPETHEWFLPALSEELQHKGPPGKFGGHTVLCIGYDDNRQRVLVQNSEGKEHGKKPWFWMDYSWIRDWEASDDFWMVRSLERQDEKA